MALALHLHLPSATRAAAAGVASQQGRRAAHVKQTWLPRRRVAGGGGSACAASSGGEEYGPFQGAFGEWRIEAEDLAEVWAYRGGLTATAAGAWAGRERGCRGRRARACCVPAHAACSIATGTLLLTLTRLLRDPTVAPAECLQRLPLARC